MNILSALQTLRAGYDTYERHRLVSSQLEDPGLRVVDVGGRKGQLRFFCSNPIIVLNLDQGDVIANGLDLPFKAGAFDAAVSLDVLEHIAVQNRGQLVSELLRVARTKVIFCAPYGSPQHEEVERELERGLAQKGITHVMLSEHVRFGLPTPSEILPGIPPHFRTSILYSGDFRFNLLLFKVDQWMGSRFKIIKAAISLILNLIGNVIVYPSTLTNEPSYYSGRFLMVVSKTNHIGAARAE